MLKTAFNSLSLKDTLYYQKLEKELSNNARKVAISAENIIRNDRSKNYNIVKNKLKKVIKKAWSDNWRKGLSDSARKITLTYQFEDNPEEVSKIQDSLQEIDNEDDDDAEEKSFERGKFYKIYLSRRADILADRLIQSNREALAKIAAEDPKYRNKLALIEKFLDPKKSQKLNAKEKKQLNDLVAAFSSRRQFRAYIEKDSNRIARTEISAAYNFSRLESYLRQGVKYVRWQNAIENIRAGIVCPICKERNGLVFEIERALNDPELQIPSHPNCACFWEKVTERKEKLGFREKNKFRNSIIAFTVSAAGLAGGYLAEAFRASRPILRAVARPDIAYTTTRALRGDTTAQQILIEQIKEEVRELPLVKTIKTKRQKKTAKRIADYIQQLRDQQLRVREKYAGNWLKQRTEYLKIDAEITKLRYILGEIVEKETVDNLTQNKLEQAWTRIKEFLLKPPKINSYQYQADLFPLPQLEKIKDNRSLNIIKRIDKNTLTKIDFPSIAKDSREVEKKIKVDLDEYAKHIAANNYVQALQDLNNAILVLERQNIRLNEIYSKSTLEFSEFEQNVNKYLLNKDLDLDEPGLLENVIRNSDTGKKLTTIQRSALNVVAKNQQTLGEIKGDRDRLLSELKGGNLQAQYRDNQQRIVLQVQREIQEDTRKYRNTAFDYVGQILEGKSTSPGTRAGYSYKELFDTLDEITSIIKSDIEIELGLETELGIGANNFDILINSKDYYRFEKILTKYKIVFDRARSNRFGRYGRFKNLDFQYVFDNFNSLVGQSLSRQDREELLLFLRSIEDRDKEIKETLEDINDALYRIKVLKQNTPTYKLLTSKRLLLPTKGVIKKDRLIEDRFINPRLKRERQGITKRAAIKRRKAEIARLREQIRLGLIPAEEGNQTIAYLEGEIKAIDETFFSDRSPGLLSFAEPKSNLNRFGLSC